TRLPGFDLVKGRLPFGSDRYGTRRSAGLVRRVTPSGPTAGNDKGDKRNNAKQELATRNRTHGCPFNPYQIKKRKLRLVDKNSWKPRVRIFPFRGPDFTPDHRQCIEID
ncbi:MAG: hypothetical protein QGG09_16605, partial [Pirellulaceae bacterium]|nr:hypothetical protein [Pirellulaceae bacterium]